MEPITSIASDGLQADIHPLGAQLFALRDADGRDLQWNGDPAVWKGRAPILFPIVGALAGGIYRLDGTTHILPRHGFARDRVFTLVESDPARALFRLDWDAETLKLYPFRFALEMLFRLCQRTLAITATIRNLETDRPLPASFGFHPAFLWPLPYGRPRDAHLIRFEKPETAPIRKLNADGTLQDKAYPSPVEGRDLILRDALFAEDALVFDHIASRSLCYGAANGPAIRIDFPDMPHLGLWTKPGAGFICIEPWHGHADAQGFSGDFRTRPGGFLVVPGAAEVCSMAISLCPDGPL